MLHICSMKLLVMLVVIFSFVQWQKVWNFHSYHLQQMKLQEFGIKLTSLYTYCTSSKKPLTHIFWSPLCLVLWQTWLTLLHHNIQCIWCHFIRGHFFFTFWRLKAVTRLNHACVVNISFSPDIVLLIKVCKQVLNQWHYVFD